MTNSCIISESSLENKRINKYRDIATIDALKSDMEIRCGAVLIYKGKIISIGHNSYKGCAIRTGTRQCLL